MNLEDLKEQLRSQWSALVEQVQQSPTFNNIKERYESLPSKQQRTILISLITFGVLVFLYFPYSFLSSSSQFVTQYEESRDLIREMLRVSSQVKSLSGIPPSPSAMQLADQARAAVSSADLLPEQIGEIKPTQLEDAGRLAPPTIRQEAVAVELKKLNVEQVVELGYRLQGINPTVKLIGMEMTASADASHYYDTVFQLVSFNALRGEEAEGGKGKAKRPSRLRGDE